MELTPMPPLKPGDVWGALNSENLTKLAQAVTILEGRLDQFAVGTPVVKISEAAYLALNPVDPDVIYVIYATPPTVPDEPPVMVTPGTTADITDTFTNTATPPGPATTPTGTQAWRVESGTWTEGAGKLSAAADGAIIVQNLGVKTQTIEFVIAGTIGTPSFPGPVMLYDNSNDWHYRVLKQNTSELAIFRRDPTQVTVWQSNAGVVKAGDKVRVSVSGATSNTVFRIWVNNAEITTGAVGSLKDTDATPPAGTECGFRYSFASGGNTYQYGTTKMWKAVVAP